MLLTLNILFMHELLKQFPTIGPYIKAALPYVQQYGYWAIFFAIYLEDFGLPVPGETVLVICSLFAALGKLNIFLVGILGFAGAVLGDNTGFAIGHFGGRKIILKWGKYVFLTEKRLEKLENYFTKHGGRVVAIARFVQGLRQFNGIIAGISKMKWKRFLMYNLLGAALWVGLWIGVSTILKSDEHLLAVFIRRSQYILPAIFITPFIIEGIIFLVKKKKKKSRV
jgi:membrane protein DedA with SNARE-associated domain